LLAHIPNLQYIDVKKTIEIYFTLGAQPSSTSAYGSPVPSCRSARECICAVMAFAFRLPRLMWISCVLPASRSRLTTHHTTFSIHELHRLDSTVSSALPSTGSRTVTRTPAARRNHQLELHRLVATIMGLRSKQILPSEARSEELSVTDMRTARSSIAIDGKGNSFRCLYALSVEVSPKQHHSRL
jgi:hypothetical protein